MERKLQNNDTPCLMEEYLSRGGQNLPKLYLSSIIWLTKEHKATLAKCNHFNAKVQYLLEEERGTPTLCA